MTWIQMLSLILVMIGGTGVALTRDPRRQVLASSFYGVLLAVLFFAFQAPDVALSEITVGAAALPALLLLALAIVQRPVQPDRSMEDQPGE